MKKQTKVLKVMITDVLTSALTNDTSQYKSKEHHLDHIEKLSHLEETFSKAIAEAKDSLGPYRVVLDLLLETSAFLRSSYPLILKEENMLLYNDFIFIDGAISFVLRKDIIKVFKNMKETERILALDQQ